MNSDPKLIAESLHISTASPRPELVALIPTDNKQDDTEKQFLEFIQKTSFYDLRQIQAKKNSSFSFLMIVHNKPLQIY